MKISRTVSFGFAAVVLGFLETVNATDFAAFIPDQYEPLVVSGLGFVVILLRLVTSTPIFAKK